MTAPIMKKVPPTEFYRRKRKLAYTFALLSALLLFATLTQGFFLESYSRPLLALGGEQLHVAHRTNVLGSPELNGTRLLTLDPSLQPLRPPLPLMDDAGALLAEGEDVTLFFGARTSVLRGDSSVRSADLGQPWEVRAAVSDPGRRTAWIFGARDGRIVARRRAFGTWSEEIPVAPAGAVDRMTASMNGGEGPFVAWRETGAALIRSAQFDGQAFAPRVDFEGVVADHWEALPWKDRVLLVTYRKEERTWRQVALFLQCCPGCAGPPVRERLSFTDPVLVIGRRVMGLAASLVGERLVFVLARFTTIQACSVPAGTWRPDALPARLTPVGAEPLWRILTAASYPILLLFFSFSMIFLGVTLLHERGQISLLETLSRRDPGEPLPGEVLQRAMAYILDHIVLLPAFIIGVELLSVSPEVSSLDLGDPKLLGMIGVWVGLHFIYHFAMEWALGWTVGKRIIGLRVTALDGSTLGFRGALLRNLLRLVDAEYPVGVFLGTFLMMTSPRRQRLGDRWARTLVVQDIDNSRPAPKPPGV